MRNKPRKSGDTAKETKIPKPIVVHSYGELPEWYLGYPNDLDYLVKRVAQVDKKMYDRGFTVVRPLKIYSLTIDEKNIPVGKKTKKGKIVPFTFLAVEMIKHGN